MASLPFGDVTIVSARIPSVIAATIAVFLFFWSFRRIMPERSALLAAMLLPASFAWLEKVPSAEIDMMQLMWVTASLLFFLRALEDERRLRWWVASLLCVAAGFLTKWTAPAFFYACVVPLLLWQRKISLLWGWKHLTAAAVAVGVCATWAIYVNSITGGVLADSFLAEAAQRFRPSKAGKPYPWVESLLYPFEVLGANLPWSLLALTACRPSFMRRQDGPTRRLLQLLHCWTWPNLLFWSLPSQHHVRYALPISSGIAGLGIIVLIDWLKKAAPSERRFVLPLILCGWVITKIVFIEAILPPRTAHRHVRETAARLQELVPPGHTLYLCKLKDEGVMFYYGRAVRRVPSIEQPAVAHFAALLKAEWQVLQASGAPAVLVEQLADQQGDPIIVVRFP